MLDLTLEPHSEASLEDTIDEEVILRDTFLYYLFAYEDTHACVGSGFYIGRGLIGVYLCIFDPLPCDGNLLLEGHSIFVRQDGIGKKGDACLLIDTTSLCIPTCKRILGYGFECNGDIPCEDPVDDVVLRTSFL